MTKPNAIEEIMAEAMAASRRRVVPGGPPPTPLPMPKIQIDGYVHAARECLAALDAAGLAVVPKEATEQQSDEQYRRFCKNGPYHYASESDVTGPYEQLIECFDPTTWTPKP